MKKSSKNRENEFDESAPESAADQQAAIDFETFLRKQASQELPLLAELENAVDDDGHPESAIFWVQAGDARLLDLKDAVTVDGRGTFRRLARLPCVMRFCGRLINGVIYCDAPEGAPFPPWAAWKEARLSEWAAAGVVSAITRRMRWLMQVAEAMGKLVPPGEIAPSIGQRKDDNRPKWESVEDSAVSVLVDALLAETFEPGAVRQRLEALRKQLGADDVARLCDLRCTREGWLRLYHAIAEQPHVLWIDRAPNAVPDDVGEEGLLRRRGRPGGRRTALQGAPGADGSDVADEADEAGADAEHRVSGEHAVPD